MAAAATKGATPKEQATVPDAVLDVWVDLLERLQRQQLERLAAVKQAEEQAKDGSSD